MDSPVDYAVSDGVAHLTLNSPHNRNALSADLVAALHRGLADAAGDDGVRAVVLAHTGNTFCAGADLSEASGEDPGDAAAERAGELAALLRAIVSAPLPVIGAVDGHVRAGGMGLVGACDIVVAGPSSTFGLTEARIGVAPAIISLTLLPKMSPRSAGRYYLTGETFDAAEATRVGLVTLTADGEGGVAAAVAELAGQLRRASPQGLAASKALTTAAVLAGFDADAGRLAAESARLFVSEEAQEGMLAFLQKRPPRWAPPAGG